MIGAGLLLGDFSEGERRGGRVAPAELKKLSLLIPALKIHCCSNGRLKCSFGRLFTRRGLFAEDRIDRRGGFCGRVPV